MNIQDLYSIFLQKRLITTDSRNVPAGSIFFALRGDNFDGNKFAGAALDQGAAYCVIDDEQYREDERCLLVDDVLATLQALARHHRMQLTIPVLAITGTNGKTTTKELLNAVLSQQFKTLATRGNLNNHIGVPLTLLSVGPEIEFAIIEMGANHQGEIKFLCDIALPSHGLISNVGKAHLEGFGGFEGVKKTKAELYDFLKQQKGSIFINAANPHLLEMLGNYTDNVIPYGAEPPAVVRAQIIENDPFISIDWQHGGCNHRVKTRLTGTYNLENMLAAIAAGLQFGLKAEQINTGLASYVPGNNRSQIMRTDKNTVIGDYYNANPSSMAVALDNLNAVSAGRKIAILGDMFELGTESADEHAAIIKKTLQIPLDLCVFVGREFYALRALGGGLYYETTEEAYTALKEQKPEQAMILVKGSRSMKLEQLISLF